MPQRDKTAKRIKRPNNLTEAQRACTHPSTQSIKNGKKIRTTCTECGQPFSVSFGGHKME